MKLPLFVYGSMRDEEVRAVVLGRSAPAVRIEPASMPGVATALVPGESYPYLVSAEGKSAEGALIHGLDEMGLDRVLFFESDEYAFVECEVVRAGGERVAAVYLGGVSIPQTPVVATWSFEQWQAREKTRFLAMTREFMALWGHGTRDEAEAVWQRLLRERPAQGRER